MPGWAKWVIIFVAVCAFAAAWVIALILGMHEEDE